ncbi:MAG TPA: cohesin domain-containing protein [Nitrospiria bacterium]|nr:cohesin domain-containing protein [Nitrospiria bacterium]
MFLLVVQAATLYFSPEKTKVSIDNQFRLEVRVSGVQDLFGAPFRISYPTDLLEVIKIEEGDFLKKDGKKTAFLQKVDNKKGEIIIGLTRLGKIMGISGDGVILTLTFIAKKTGSATLTFQKTDLRDSNLKPLPVRTRAAKILIGKKK